MKYPTPYFSDLPYIGDLKIDYVFAEFDCPIIFTCQNDDNDLFFCICICMDNIQKWLLTKVSFDKMFDYIKNNISNRDMFIKSDNKVYILSWNYGYIKEDSQLVSGNSLTDEELPPAETFLNAFNGEFNDYFDILKNRQALEVQKTLDRFMPNNMEMLLSELKFSYIHDKQFKVVVKQDGRWAYDSILPKQDYIMSNSRLKNQSFDMEQCTDNSVLNTSINSLKAS